MLKEDGAKISNLSTTAKKGITAEIRHIINEGSVGNLAMFYLVPCIL